MIRTSELKYNIKNKSLNDLKKYLQKYSRHNDKIKLKNYLTSKQIILLNTRIKTLDIQNEKLSTQWINHGNKNMVLNLGLREFKRENPMTNIHDKNGTIKFSIVFKSMVIGRRIIDYCIRENINLSNWQL